MLCMNIMYTSHDKKNCYLLTYLLTYYLGDNIVDIYNIGFRHRSDHLVWYFSYIYNNSPLSKYCYIY